MSQKSTPVRGTKECDSRAHLGSRADEASAPA